MPTDPGRGSSKPGPATVTGAQRISVSGTPGAEVMSLTKRPSPDFDRTGSLHSLLSTSCVLTIEDLNDSLGIIGPNERSGRYTEGGEWTGP